MSVLMFMCNKSIGTILNDTYYFSQYEMMDHVIRRIIDNIKYVEPHVDRVKFPLSKKHVFSLI